MAHFFLPPGVPKSGYLIDGRLAPDSVSRVWLAKGGEKPIGLWGGRDLWIKAATPGILGYPIFARDHGKDAQIVTLEGKELGTTVLETGLGSAKWVSLTVQVVTPDASRALDDWALARPFDITVIQKLAADFVAAFADGLAQKLDATLALDLAAKLNADQAGFQKGYIFGLLVGLWEGFKSLLEAIKLLVDISVMATPQGLIREVFLNLTSDAHRRMRAQQLENASKLKQMADAAMALMLEIAAQPNLYAPYSRPAGLILGAEVAEDLAKEARGMSAEAIGKFAGKIVGWVLFEILAQILMAVFTEGAGNVAKGGLSVVENGGAAARLITRLERTFEALPALRRLILGMRAEESAVSVAAAALDAEIELAFGEAAVLQRGSRGGFPILEKLPQLSKEAQLAASKLLGQQLNPELMAAWNACSNPQAVSEIAEVQRLLKTGAAADREAAYVLSERTYGNWRNRFWTRVRGDEGLKRIFTDAGASFEGKSGAPFFKIDGTKTKNLTVTLDHFIERRVDNPARAVDALNVRPVLSFENSATLEAIRRDNFIKGWASPR